MLSLNSLPGGGGLQRGGDWAAAGGARHRQEEVQPQQGQAEVGEWGGRRNGKKVSSKVHEVRCTRLYCIELHYTAPYCTKLQLAKNTESALRCTTLHKTASHWTILCQTELKYNTKIWRGPMLPGTSNFRLGWLAILYEDLQLQVQLYSFLIGSVTRMPFRSYAGWRVKCSRLAECNAESRACQWIASKIKTKLKITTFKN